MKPTKKQQTFFYLAFLFWGLWVVWWLTLRYFDGPGTTDDFTDSYGLVALFGGVATLLTGRNWGTFKTRFGAAISFFGLGLLFQFLGQFTYAIMYRVFDQELAFPSVGDVPYLLSILSYIAGLVFLLRTINYNRNALKLWWVGATGLVVMIGVTYAAYAGFLHLAIEDDRGTMVRFLNVAYPVLQSVYFLLGVTAILQSRMITKGKLYLSVSLLLAALVMQYLADYIFLYQAYHETWQPGGINDLVFLTAYGLMTLSIFNIERNRRG